MSGEQRDNVVWLRPRQPHPNDQLPKTGHVLLDDRVLRAFTTGRHDAIGIDEGPDWWDLGVAIKAVKRELDR